MLTDLFVIVIYFLAIFCIGIYAGRKQNSLTDYALGNRSLPWWAILASILAAEISAATFLGAPGEGYHTRNFTYAQLCIGTILGRIIVGRLFLKPYYDYKVVSIYEYLEKRFGLLTRRTASMVFLISRVLASGTRLYFAGILLVIAYQFLTGVTANADQIVLLYIAALVAISVATTIYTAIGGLKAVVWTDVLQAVVLGVSMLSALWVLFSHIPGGWSSISAAMNGGDDWKFFSWGTGEGLDFLQQGARVLGQEYTVWEQPSSPWLRMARTRTWCSACWRQKTARRERVQSSYPACWTSPSSSFSSSRAFFSMSSTNTTRQTSPPTRRSCMCFPTSSSMSFPTASAGC